MGICYSTEETDNIKFFALKIPNGTQYLHYDNKYKKFIHHANINTWIQNLYSQSRWTNWLIYNDDTSKLGIPHTKSTHSKGILTWSSNRIGWLCHSVPNFPSYFDGKNISEIEQSELIYGQSFQYIEIPFNVDLLDNILQQLFIMNINIYIELHSSNYVNFDTIKFKNINNFNTIKITDDIIHVAKPQFINLDIYSKYVAKDFSYSWKIETGHSNYKIEEKTSNIQDIKTIKFENITFNSNQDNSKWAVTTDQFYWIGDHNRIISHLSKGGGGFICKDLDLVLCLQDIIDE